MRPISALGLALLDTETGVEAGEVGAAALERTELDARREQMLINVDRFTMMIESGQGNRTSPLILLDSVMNAEVKNWSSALEASAAFTLKASYYNSVLALWEPFLEPVGWLPSPSFT